MTRLFATFTIVALALLAAAGAQAKSSVKLEPSRAWSLSEPLGLQYPATIDTLPHNYHQRFVPSAVSRAWTTTGNYGAEGQNQLFFERKMTGDFFFADALDAWLPTLDKQRFYNTRIPMTLLSYSTGGNKYSNQDRTTAVFSGNAGKRLQAGAMMDYIYSKGSFDYQADKDFSWGLNTSYMGDRYEMQAFFNSYNFLNKESGGITDDRYITDPAAVQGGDTRVDFKNIPTRLTATHNRLSGREVYMNHRYKVGYYHYMRDSVADTIVGRVYVPVTSFIWTMDYKAAKHLFLNTSASDDTAFFSHTYLRLGGTDETTSYWALTNTVGVSLLEGFNKYAKFGFALYATHSMRRYTQVADSTSAGTQQGLTPLPVSVDPRHTDNLVWVGGQLTKQRGSILTYAATAQFGVAGSVAGDIDVTGDVATRFRLMRDSVTVRGYGYFKNLEVPYLMQQFVSNHYAWANKFGKVKRLRLGGELTVPHTGTRVNAGYETLKSYVFFNAEGVPEQHNAPVHVLSATIDQRLGVGILHWDNAVTYQTTSNADVLPLPKLAVYSNLYLNFAVARVLKVQLGVDCNYYTRYYAPAYNPATMSWHTQHEQKCGNFTFMNAYANFKLKRARFYLLYSHVNGSSLGGKAYFSTPHYPLNPGRFQMGVSVDFAN